MALKGQKNTKYSRVTHSYQLTYNLKGTGPAPYPIQKQQTQALMQPKNIGSPIKSSLNPQIMSQTCIHFLQHNKCSKLFWKKSVKH